MTIELTLPMPPSVNQLYANRKGGRMKTKKYSDWIYSAGWALEEQGLLSIKGDVEVYYYFGPRCRKSDVFNREKAISDLLVSHRVIEDDRKIVKGTVAWADIEGCRVEIWPA